ncbi:MAG: class IV adenylate cyclase [Alphaproteobacteria bacterium]|nr:class IV adenylate cyclase [Alphaproteobacteria bacterium]
MGRNIEIKAKIGSIGALLPAVEKIADSQPQEIFQDDTFFFCSSGRLKLRMFSEAEGQLISYSRPNKSGPKECIYTIYETSSPRALGDVLASSCGILGKVVKRRTLYMCGNTRIHLDKVEGLGDFLELEVVLSDTETAESGIKTANDILSKLGISNNQLIEGAYVDLALKAEE